MHALTKPKYFMPIHGEQRHLITHKRLAEEMGMPENHIFVSEIGKVLELDRDGARFSGSVPSGKILVDGLRSRRRRKHRAARPQTSRAGRTHCRCGYS